MLELSLLDVVKPSVGKLTDYTQTPPVEIEEEREATLMDTVSARLALRLFFAEETDDLAVRKLLDDDSLEIWSEFRFQEGAGNDPVKSPDAATYSLELTSPINGEETQTLTVRKLKGQDMRIVGELMSTNEVRALIATVSRATSMTFDSALLLRLGDFKSLIDATNFLTLSR